MHDVIRLPYTQSVHWSPWRGPPLTKEYTKVTDNSYGSPLLQQATLLEFLVVLVKMTDLAKLKKITVEKRRVFYLGTIVTLWSLKNSDFSSRVPTNQSVTQNRNFYFPSSQPSEQDMITKISHYKSYTQTPKNTHQTEVVLEIEPCSSDWFSFWAREDPARVL